MRTFRFGVNAHLTDPAAWFNTCRTVEEQGYDVLLAPDHLGAPSPFVMLASAAAATTRLRLGTYVLNNEFWNPALLAREAASLDRVSGGRFELGLGSGHMKAEFDDAGIPWLPYAERTANLAESVDELDRRLRPGGQEPQSTQNPRPPLLIGGHGPTTLTLAARRADIVGFSGLTQMRRRRLGTFQAAGAAETSRRVELVRETAGDRADDIELSVLVQIVRETDDAERTIAEITENLGSERLPRGESLLDCPYVLIGTREEMAETLLRRRELYGFSYVCAHGADADELAKVIPLVRAVEHDAV